MLRGRLFGVRLRSEAGAALFLRETEDDAEIYGRADCVGAIWENRGVAECARDAERRAAEAARRFRNAFTVEDAFFLHDAGETRFAFAATLKRTLRIER